MQLVILKTWVPYLISRSPVIMNLLSFPSSTKSYHCSERYNHFVLLSRKGIFPTTALKMQLFYSPPFSMVWPLFSHFVKFSPGFWYNTWHTCRVLFYMYKRTNAINSVTFSADSTSLLWWDVISMTNKINDISVITWTLKIYWDVPWEKEGISVLVQKVQCRVRAAATLGYKQTPALVADQ